MKGHGRLSEKMVSEITVNYAFRKMWVAMDRIEGDMTGEKIEKSPFLLYIFKRDFLPILYPFQNPKKCPKDHY